MNHLRIGLVILSHLAPFREQDLTLVAGPDDGHKALDKYHETGDFFKKKDGYWELKGYDHVCEYCKEANCDRMLFWDQLDYSSERMHDKQVWSNAKKRKFMYASYINDKWGYLGEGERRRVPGCVYKHIGDMFPPPAGQARMGHQDE